MIRKTDIEQVLRLQKAALKRHKTYEREMLGEMTSTTDGFVLIVSGIRRCGKSTLMEQMIGRTEDDWLYLNFDTARLYGFGMDDFAVLDIIISEQEPATLFFDEIQIVEGWEVYVRGKLDEGFRVVVTGSNASMLSRELGTKLTGRHVSRSLYPFSYAEYLGFRGLTRSVDSFSAYMREGGFPGYLKTREPAVLDGLLTDILYRDVMVRYGIRDEGAIKQLALFLMSNIGCLVSASKLTQALGVKTSKTVLEYFDYLENAYLFFFVRKFSYSFKAQILNPRKVYAIDMGLHNVVSPSATADSGHKLENAVFLELVRRGQEVYYYSESGFECDFVVCDHGKPVSLIQVCEVLTPDNTPREAAGIVRTMAALNVSSGVILTMSQRDVISMDGVLIDARPVWEHF